MIRQTALAAEALIREHERQIAALRQIVEAWKTISVNGSGSGNVAGEPGIRRRATEQGLRAAHGQVVKHVHAVLSDGQEYTPAQIRDLCAGKFAAIYSRDTIFSILRRGREARRYENRDGRWRMKAGSAKGSSG